MDGPIPEGPPMVIGERSQLKYPLRWQDDEDDEKDARVLFDFEAPSFEDWTVTGDAFAKGPTSTKPRGEGEIYGAVGGRLANSFHQDLKDGMDPRGSLVRDCRSCRVACRCRVLVRRPPGLRTHALLEATACAEG